MIFRKTAGSVQLCAWQISGVEAAVHAIQESFHQNETEAALLVNASINSLNHNTAIYNIRSITCHYTYQYLIGHLLNYLLMGTQSAPKRGPRRETSLQCSGYSPSDQELTHVSKTSLVCRGGNWSISNLRTWWDDLTTLGPSLGYSVNAPKTWLITKEKHHSEAISPPLQVPKSTLRVLEDHISGSL